MQSNHASALRGLSIAVVIIAGLSILACIIAFIGVAVGGSFLANTSPDMWSYYLDDDFPDYAHGYYGFDGSSVAAITALMIGLGGFLLLWELALSAVGLIAGIICLRNYNQPAKLNLVFGWSLAGAIAAFLSGSIAVMVILIIVCVFAYKDKTLAAGQPMAMPAPAPMPTTAPAPAPGPAPVVPSQPVEQAVVPVRPVETVVIEETKAE